jgi:anti-sigma B factor antagonist
MTAFPPSPDGFAAWPTAGLLHVDVRRAASGVVVAARGDLERASVPTLAGSLAEVLGTVGPGETIVVDLAGVDFIDVGGLLLLLGATRRAAERGGTLYLAGCDALSIKVLQLTGNLDAVNIAAAEWLDPDGAANLDGAADPGGAGGTGTGTAHPNAASSSGASSNGASSNGASNGER